jgi:hypothetical protein
MDGLFRKSLTDLVRGIRANKKDEHKFITKCLQEIKEELRSTDKKVKVIAIQKLTYVCCEPNNNNHRRQQQQPSTYKLDLSSKYSKICFTDEFVQWCIVVE